jgi:hypothetical protein
VVVALLVAGCQGFTTEATNIAKQPDGSYSAQLNFVVSCGSGEHCSWYVHYRLLGTSTWTNVPSMPHGLLAGPVSNVPLSEEVTGLTARAHYEYQVCGNSQPGQQFVCAGPDDTPNTTTKFTTAAAWSLQSTPTPIGGGSLNAVSCSSATACTAVGSSNGLTLAERWDGTNWAMQTTPNPSGATHSGLSGVSCNSATACIAVGWYTMSGNKFGGELPLAEFWDGSTWKIQDTAIPNDGPGLYGGSLSGVSCTSVTACTAVGWVTLCAAACGCCGLAVAERWNGTSWTMQTPMPLTDPDFLYSSLSEVSCTSTTACTAVGSAPANDSGTLAEFWDGTSWTIQTSPTSSVPGTNLSGVSCKSATACIAVGGTLAELWNGTSWTIQTTPRSGGDLNEVSCTSATTCTAVGSGAGGLADFWNGSTWTVQTTPTPSGATSNNLSGVSCTSATECTAVGSYVNGNGTQVTLAERYG